MARRSQCSSDGDNPLDPNYLPPHYREEYRLAIDHLIEEDLEGYYQFLQKADVVDFLSLPEIQYIQSSVQVPQQRNNPEQHFLEPGGDNSSDTYWPMHSDLDAPGLDLGWPQLHHFIGPTEVTTLVNPPEPEMPSIKEQARRLIKNAQQVIAIVMDMFTDVDVFADILDAAMRNVAVYLILDEQNAHHFVNMASNCRVNLQNIQFLRVRTLSGVTYHCRSGKSFKGQMMDRFLLTDCRAVLSGNYSFTWSFEKLHRCMAHLFLGQLVSTFDEEFRILFAQSQPLMMENFPPMEEFSLSKNRQYPSDRILYREPKNFQSLDAAHPEEWPRHSYDQRMEVDWRMMPLKKQEPLHGPADVYSRLQKSRMDHGPAKMPLTETLAVKRHSYAEDDHGRFSYPFLQQRMPEPENKEWQSQRGQQPGKEADYSGYDKFWDQDFYSADQYLEPGLPQDMEPHDLVHSYLLSTRNADYGQGSEKLPPAADLPFGSPRHRRSNVGQPYACQTSPAPSSLTDQKQFFQKPHSDCKDPVVKRGLRNWRISSYLSACDTQDEGLPSTSPDASDTFEEPSNALMQAPGTHISVPKIANVREFKIPAIPRASQMPGYAKINVQEQKLPDEPTAEATETKTTPTPSESSSTTGREKVEGAEPKEPQTPGLRRGESFRRKYNAALPRNSRLRSSLIFSSLELQNTSQDTKQDEESDKNEAEQTKLTGISQVIGQRRPKVREPFQWSRDMKSVTFHNSASELSKPEDENSKDDDKDSSKDKMSEDLSEVQESLKPPAEEQVRPEKQLKPLLPNPPYVDMSDPDSRLLFFKELAAKRKAAKAAEAEKRKEKAPMKPPAEDSGKTAHTEAHKSLSPSLDTRDKANEQNRLVTADLNISDSCQQEQTRVSPPSETRELENSQSAASMPVSAQTEATQSKPPQELNLSNAAVKQSSPIPPSTPPPSLAHVNDKSESQGFESTTKKSGSLSPGVVEEPPSSEFAGFCVNTPNSESVHLETSISSSPPLPPEQDTVSELSTSDPSDQSPFASNTVQDSGSQMNPSPSPSSCALIFLSAETKSPEDLSSSLTSSALLLNAEASVSLSPPEPSQLTSSETLSAAESAHVPSDFSPDKCAAGRDLITSPSQSSEMMNNLCGPTPSKPVAKLENSSTPKGGESLDIGSSNNVTSESPPPNFAPSSAELCLHNVSELESKSISAQNDTNTSTLSPGEPPLEHSAAKSISTVLPDSPPNAAQSESQATPPSCLNLTTSVSCSSPLTKFVGSVCSPEAEKTLTTLHSHSDSGGFPEQIATHSTETAMPQSTETSCSTEPTPEVPTEPTQPSKTPEPVAFEAHPAESPVSAEPSHIDRPDPYGTNTDDTEATNEGNKTTIEESACSEQINQQVDKNNCSELPEVPSEAVVPASPQSKMPKSSPSRYQSSTANLISSSNLRDDTKLLLEQISANSQSRIEAAKECPVTDDEKEDEADKNAKREKERGIRSLSRGQPKTSEQRQQALEKIQTMRKERKVYSRFEMAP